MKNIFIQIIIVLFFTISTQAQVDFGDPNDLTGQLYLPTTVYSADFDGDGDKDLVSSSEGDDKIVWFENIDGNGTFSFQKIISTNADHATYVFAADIDGDGDMDVLSASSGDNKIAWYKNTDGSGTFSSEIIISTDASGTKSVYAGDLDGDGDIDVLSTAYSDNKVVWYENTDGAGTFSSEIIIASNLTGVMHAIIADIDGDMDNDIIGASSSDNKVVWYENTDGAGTFSAENIISTEVSFPIYVCVADMDGDSFLDVLSASYSDNKIAWYQNTDGTGNFSAQNVISTNTEGASAVKAADLDNDGDIDVVAASFADNKFSWFENIDGNGTSFSETLLYDKETYSAYSVYIDDIDNDNDNDIFTVSYNFGDISLYKNTDGNANFSKESVLATAYVAADVFAADIDNDGDLDIISASIWDDKTAWYENLDGNGTFSKQKIISEETNGASSVFIADIDGDNDNDIVVASRYDDKVVWFENTDGNGTFSSQITIGENEDGIIDVIVADIDGDGFLDVIAACVYTNTITWYRNTDGNGTFSDKLTISTTAIGVEGMSVADIDGDNDMDVIYAGKTDEEGRVMWFENTDGQGNFSSEISITDDLLSAISVFAVDIDGDLDNDIVATSFGGSKQVWFENIDGNGNFSDENILSSTISGHDCYPADIDNDGDIDLIFACFLEDKTVLFENLDGNGTFSEEQIISSQSDNVKAVFVADINGDGKQDVLSANAGDNKITWFENLTIISNQSEISDLSKTGISIYPNPTKGIINLELLPETNHITITDMTGKIISYINKMDENKIDISNFENGIYLINIRTENSIQTKKIIKH